MTPQTKMNMTSQIKAQLVNQGVPEEEAHQKATVLVEQKASRTQTGVMIVGVGIIGGVTSYFLQMHVLYSFCSIVGGCLWGMYVISGEYLKASLKDLYTGVAEGIKTIKDAIKGGQ